MRPEPYAAGAVRWLGGIAPALPAKPRVRHTALALAHLCTAVDDATAGLSAAIVAELAGDGSALDFTAPPLVPALLSAAAVSRMSRGPAGDAAAGYVALLREVSAGTAGANAAAVRAALTAGVGGLTSPVTVDVPVDLLWSREPRDRDAVPARVEEATAFGTRPAVAEAALPRVLEGAAFDLVRRYDLPAAMRYIRAVAYLGERETFGIRELGAFLESGWRVDGSFGHYETAFARMRHGGHGEAEVALVALEVTAQALWTCAELADPGWRLFDVAFRPLREPAEVATC